MGLEARAHCGVLAGDNVLDVYAIPTTRGVLTLVCAARSGTPEAPTWCLERTRPDHRGRAHGPLKPDAGTAYRMRAPGHAEDARHVPRERARRAPAREGALVGQ